jgi:hypothetical protein
MSKVAARGPKSVQYQMLLIQSMVQQAGIGIGKREPRLPGDSPWRGTCVTYSCKYRLYMISGQVHQPALICFLDGVSGAGTVMWCTSE